MVGAAPASATTEITCRHRRLARRIEPLTPLPACVEAGDLLAALAEGGGLKGCSFASGSAQGQDSPFRRNPVRSPFTFPLVEVGTTSERSSPLSRGDLNRPTGRRGLRAPERTS